jgi:uncharacterized protein (TIGR02421 family)
MKLIPSITSLEQGLSEIRQFLKVEKPFSYQPDPNTQLVCHEKRPWIIVSRTKNETLDRIIEHIIYSEPIYYISTHGHSQHETLLEPLYDQLVAEYGGCLIIELWTEQEQQEQVVIHIAQKTVLPIAEKLQQALIAEDPIHTWQVKLQKNTRKVRPPGFHALLAPTAPLHPQLFYIGLALKDTSDHPPDMAPSSSPLMRHTQHKIVAALRRIFLEFVRMHTTHKVTQFGMLNKTKKQKLVWEIDHKLITECQKVDFLLLVTPVNEPEAFEQFKKEGYKIPPRFRYRPMVIDPEDIKRNLYNIPIEEITDPTIAFLFRDKRREMDAQLSMLMERGNEGFRLGSLQVFGYVTPHLYEIAKALLLVYPAHDPTDEKKEYLDAYAFARQAEIEFEYLKQQLPSIETSIRIRDDLTGIMVNRGVLHIGESYKIEKSRCQAMIQHEVGTHLVTYFNGKAQPLKLFSLGVPGYEQLQEGLAVFSEYLMGGLSRQRLRLLAGRVVAVQDLLAGKTFTQTFQHLVEAYGFAEDVAFHMTTRVYRSGGLTKDALYLKGLIEILDYVRDGKDLQQLTIGKIRSEYLPIVEELTQRGWMIPAQVIPRYLKGNVSSRLEKIKDGSKLFELATH